MLQTEIKLLAIDDIQVESSPRTGEDHQALESLQRDIERRGLQTPLEVAELPSGKHVLLHGGRRLRALRAAGQREAACLVLDKPSEDLWYSQARTLASTRSLREIDRMFTVLQLCASHSGEDPEEILKAWKKLAKDDSKPGEEPKGDPEQRAILSRVLADLGVWPMDSFLAGASKLLRLPAELLTAHHVGEIDAEQAFALARIKDASHREKLMGEARRGKKSGMQIAQAAKTIREMEKEQEKGAEHDGDPGDNSTEGSEEEGKDGEKLPISELEQALQKRIERLPEKLRPDARKHLRGLIGMLELRSS